MKVMFLPGALLLCKDSYGATMWLKADFRAGIAEGQERVGEMREGDWCLVIATHTEEWAERSVRYGDSISSMSWVFVLFNDRTGWMCEHHMKTLHVT